MPIGCVMLGAEEDLCNLEVEKPVLMCGLPRIPHHGLAQELCEYTRYGGTASFNGRYVPSRQLAAREWDSTELHVF